MEIRKNKHNGVDYTVVDYVSAEGTLTTENAKFTLKGDVSISTIENSWKFGDQLQFTIWSRTPAVLEERNKSNFNQLALYFPIDVIPDIIKALGLLKNEHEKSIEKKKDG